MKKILLVLLVTLVPALAFAAGPKVPVDPAGNDLADKESLKRGFRAYINYCLACHQFLSIGTDRNLWSPIRNSWSTGV